MFDVSEDLTIQFLILYITKALYQLIILLINKLFKFEKKRLPVKSGCPLSDLADFENIPVCFCMKFEKYNSLFYITS